MNEQTISTEHALSSLNEKDESEKETKDFMSWITVKRVLKTLLILGIIALMILFTKVVQKTFKIIRAEFQDTLGDVWFPILLTVIFSLWLSISPNGSAPTILSGVIWSKQMYLAIPISYVSINIGAFLNLLWIRHIVIKHEQSKCVRFVLKLLFIEKLRKKEFIKKLFETWHPIKILIILRLPYFNAGITNYLFSFQPDKINKKQYVIGNALGFIPGATLFCLFGSRISILFDNISNAESYSKGFKENKIGIILLSSCVLAVIIAYAILLKYVRCVIKRTENIEEKDNQSC